jgi:hypothetical protein
VHRLKIIVTEIQTNPVLQLAATALAIVMVIVLVTVLAISFSGQQRKH